uniref:Aspartic peptidase n=1 Tax=Chloropicon primus TaxID=1764295 RepID=A0A7S2T4G4_9CHLO
MRCNAKSKADASTKVSVKGKKGTKARNTLTARTENASTDTRAGGDDGGAGNTYLDHVLTQLTRTQLPFLQGASEASEGADLEAGPWDSSKSVVVVQGEAKHLGMKCTWKQHFHYNTGAFCEELVNDDMHVWWGYDGKDTTWEVDFSGLPSILELDDKETSLLCTWIRNGIWLVPGLRENQLKITLAEEVKEPGDWQLLREQSYGRAAGSQGRGVVVRERQGKAGGGSDSTILEVQLKEGKVKARLQVCTKTWRPMDLTLPVCGDIEKTTYTDFEAMCKVDEGELDVVYPRHTVQVASGGGKNEYWATECYLRDANEEKEGSFDLFTVPEVPLFPPDTSFDADMKGEIDYFQARSGHIVVKPKINGKEIPGMMILDTGASGFVITKKLADDLDLEAFGELYVAGVTQKVKSQFRRASSIQLGPVCMRNPLFMEMNIDGVVHGSPEPVVGILGYDFFRRCVVEMPPLEQTVLRSGFVPSSYMPRPERKIMVYDPTQYEELNHKYADKLVWKDLQLVANVPHIYATFGKDSKNGSAKDGGEEEEHLALFMLDSGAGGAGIMFHARASQEYQLLEPSELESLSNTKSIRGIGGEASSGGMKVIEGKMKYLQVSGARFENVLSLIAMGGGFDLSLHTAGMICADLMVQCRVIFDYPRRRFAMIQGE